MSVPRILILIPALLAAAQLWAQDLPKPADQQAPKPAASPKGSSANEADRSATPAPDPAQPAAPPPGGNRVFGVLPNYRTADASQEGTVLTSHEKLAIAAKDSFDYPLVLTAGLLAGLSQITNQAPSFGQGVKGFGHRWLTSYADQASGNMFTEGFFPVLLHEDPRYFRRGSGSVASRAFYALTRVVVTHKDSGGSRFNYSEWLGNMASVGISNAYYPDNRNFGDNGTKVLTQVGTDAAAQVLKEFWPDVRRKLFHK